MALLTLFINKPTNTQIQRKIGNQTTAIILDAQTSEEFQADAETTDHPIEAGAPISDGAILKPQLLTISGIVSSSPLNLGASIAGVGATVGGAVGSTLGKKLGSSGLGALGGTVAGGLAGKSLAGVLGQSSGAGRLESTINELVATRDSRAPVDIQTGLKLYKGFILTSCKVNRDQKDGKKIRVTCSFKELRIVSSEVVKITIPKIPGGMAKGKLGRQSAADPNDSQGKGSSIAYKLYKGID